ncbi:polyprenyl synthetase family protein [Nakamurella silvestris]|nr:polyprenyl synthetase family protein [Nakamurella silvestris]
MKPTSATEERPAATAGDPGAYATAVDAATARAAAATAAAWAELRGRRAGTLPEMAELVSTISGLDGGKYLRPRLAAATYHGLGGSDDGVIDTISSALQSLHLGLCIHDDLIDRDELRHGRFNVAATVRRADLESGQDARAAERQGTAAGLLAGDLAVNLCLRTLAHCRVDPAVRHDLILETLAAVEDTIAGEWLDLRSELAPLDTDLPLTVAELKTAGYSMILPLRLGAVASGGATAEILAALTTIGRNLGIAYQLVDDELGLFGDPARTGKSTVSDLREGKRTELVRLAHVLGSDSDRELLTAEVGNPDLTEHTAARLRSVVEDSGARSALREEISRASRVAKELARESLPAALGRYLADLATRSERRDH